MNDAGLLLPDRKKIPDFSRRNCRQYYVEQTHIY